MTGFAEDIRLLSGICLISLRIERGVQNKVLEAMSTGKPLISSSAAIQRISAYPFDFASVHEKFRSEKPGRRFRHCGPLLHRTHCPEAVPFIQPSVWDFGREAWNNPLLICKECKKGFQASQQSPFLIFRTLKRPARRSAKMERCASREFQWEKNLAFFSQTIPFRKKSGFFPRSSFAPYKKRNSAFSPKMSRFPLPKKPVSFPLLFL